MYYVSHALFDAETQYLNIKFFSYALIITSQKLQHNFQGQLVVVYMDQPLKKVLYKLETSGQLVSWAVELSQFALEYRPRTIIKGPSFGRFRGRVFVYRTEFAGSIG